MNADRPPVSGEPHDHDPVRKVGWENAVCIGCGYFPLPLHEGRWITDTEWAKTTYRASTGAALDVAFLRRLADYSWGLHLAGTPNEAEAIGLIEELRARLSQQKEPTNGD